MAEINRLSVFSDAGNTPQRALVDSQRRAVVVVDNLGVNTPGGIIPGINVAVPNGAETTIVSYTVPAGYKMHITGWVGSGTADATFKLYMGITWMMTLRNSVANQNVGREWSNPIEAVAGVVIEIRVKHTELAVQEFSAALEGYLVSV